MAELHLLKQKSLDLSWLKHYWRKITKWNNGQIYEYHVVVIPKYKLVQINRKEFHQEQKLHSKEKPGPSIITYAQTVIEIWT